MYTRKKGAGKERRKEKHKERKGKRKEGNPPPENWNTKQTCDQGAGRVPRMKLLVACAISPVIRTADGPT